MQSRLKVSFVEDDPVFSNLLHTSISESVDMQLIGSGASVAQGLALLQSAPSDVLLVDLGLPDGSGLDIIRQARRCWPSCEVMVISAFGDRINILSAITAGASSYLLKDMTQLQVAQEIRTLVAGGSAISPSIARELLNHVRQVEAKTVSTAPQEPSVSLTQREHEVLLLAHKGLTYGEIATNLSLSVHTVRTYVKRTYQKLRVTSKTEALYELQRAGKISG